MVPSVTERTTASIIMLPAAGIKGNPGQCFGTIAHDGHVTDASDILHGGYIRCMLLTKNDLVKVGYQWGSLTSGGNIGGAKVSHSGNACTLRDDRRFANLESRLAGNMVDCLTMRKPISDLLPRTVLCARVPRSLRQIVRRV